MTAGVQRRRERTDQVWIDQGLCTGDGLCAQIAPEIFELDIDGIAYVKSENGQPQRSPGHQVAVPAQIRPAVTAAVVDCPAACIHLVTVARANDDA